MRSVSKLLVPGELHFIPMQIFNQRDNATGLVESMGLE